MGGTRTNCSAFASLGRSSVLFGCAKNTCRLEENLIDFLLKLVSFGLYGFIGYCFLNVCKVIVAAMICNHPELSDDKVKYLTRMISKNEH